MQNINLYKKWLSNEEFEKFYKEIYSNTKWLPNNICSDNTLKFSIYASKDFVLKKVFPNQNTLPYTAEILALKQLVEIYTEQRYNTCLIVHTVSNASTNFALNPLFENLQKTDTSIAFVCLHKNIKISINDNFVDLYNGDLMEYNQILSKNIPLIFYSETASFSLFFLNLKTDNI